MIQKLNNIFKRRSIWILLVSILCMTNILQAIHLFIPHFFCIVLHVAIILVLNYFLFNVANYYSNKDNDDAFYDYTRHKYFKTRKSQNIFLVCWPILTIYIGLVIVYALSFFTQLENNITYFDGLIFGLAAGLFVDKIFAVFKDYSNVSYWLLWCSGILDIVLIVRAIANWEVACYALLILFFFLILFAFKNAINR